jgi:hypothetical protein
MKDRHDKSERALKLLEQGLAVYQIAERIGSTSRSTSAMILQARRRRAKEAPSNTVAGMEGR